MIQNLLQEVANVRPQKIARNTARAIFNKLDSYTTNVTIYLPIAGITLQLEEGKFEIGNITLQVMTQEKADELQSHITSALMTTSNTPDEKQSFIHHFTERINQIFKDKDRLYAVYRTVAEPIQAEILAKEECHKVFDLLRYALPLWSTRYPMDFSIPKKYIDNDKTELNKFTPRDKKINRDMSEHIFFGIEGETGSTTDIIRNTIILTDSQSFRWNSSRKGSFLSLPINSHFLEGLEIAKVFEASKILKKDEVYQTNFERCILRSIHWFANAQTPMQPEYIFLSLMSSIEAFLNPPDHEKTTVAVVEGVAALGGKQGYNYTKKRMNCLYDKRSALSHGDRAEIMERDISELRAIAFYLIHQMLQRTDEFTTKEQLYEEVKKIREQIKQDAANSSSINN